MRKNRMVGLAFLVGMYGLIVQVSPAMAADKIPALAIISGILPDAERTKFTQERGALEIQLGKFKAAAAAFNAKTAANQTDDEYNTVQAQRTAYVKAVQAFNRFVATAMEAVTIKNMNALAKELGWSEKKQGRLAAALKNLVSDGDPNVTGAQISQTWKDVEA